MRTILIFVSTLDGKVTKWGDPKIRSWSSENDQDYFDAIWNDTRVIIMGSGTYNPDPVKPSSEHLFIVMTKQQDKYQMEERAGQLEFTGDSPSFLIKRFEKEGEEKILVVGGPHIATAFLKEQLIDELWLTFEPKIFGIGASFVTEEKLDIALKLLSCTTANSQGTLMIKYMVIRAEEQKNS
jgi:dihydrofolate reductase